jgi:hypothetical protein
VLASAKMLAEGCNFRVTHAVEHWVPSELAGLVAVG